MVQSSKAAEAGDEIQGFAVDFIKLTFMSFRPVVK